MARPKGVRSWVNDTSVDQLAIDLSSTPGGANLYSVNVSWIGQTAGDRIAIYNDADGAGLSSATKVFEFVLPTAVGTFAAVFPTHGKVFDQGLWVNFQLSDASATKCKVDIGWDYIGS